MSIWAGLERAGVDSLHIVTGDIAYALRKRFCNNDIMKKCLKTTCPSVIIFH